MFDMPPLPPIKDQEIWLVIDPAAGGPQSDYGIISICRQRGCVTVSLCENVEFLTLLNELGDGYALIYRKLHDDSAAQIKEKTLQFSVVLYNFNSHDMLLKSLVYIQQQEENGKQFNVRHATDFFMESRQFSRISSVEENLRNGRDRLVYQFEQKAMLVHREEILNDVGYLASFLMRGPKLTTCV